MTVSRRKQFGIKAVVAYALFAAAWIFLSDSLLTQFSDPANLARYGTVKGIAFVLVTSALLWFTVMNAPTEADATDADLDFGEHLSAHPLLTALAWGLGLPLLAALAQWAVWEHIRPFAWVFGFPAVLAAAWLGGWFASVLATLVTSVAVWLVFIPSLQNGQTTQPAAAIASGIFIAMGLLAGLAIEWVRRVEHRAGNSKFRALVEQSLAGIYVLQGERILYANPAIARMFGYDNPRDITEGARMQDLVAPADWAFVKQQLQRPPDDPTRRHSYRVTGLRRDGTQMILEVHGRALPTREGQVTIGLALDVTERRTHELALREQQTLLDRMSALAKVGAWRIDTATGRGTRTAEAARILDLDPEQPASLIIDDGLKYFDGQAHASISRAFAQAQERGEPYDLELPLTSAQGARKWIHTQATPIWEEGRVVRIEGAIQDITEIQQARMALQAHHEHLEHMVRERTAELEAARQEAERLSRVKSEFLANMSHEIRTPLNGVLGLAQIGLRDHGGAARPLFEQINASGRLLLGVINDILDFSKIEAGKLHIDMQPLNLSELLAHALATVRDEAQAKGLTLHLELDKALPSTLVSDALRLEQVLLNLLSNAVKFTQRGRVRLSASAQEGRVVLAVTDTGIGMNPDELMRLFHPFEQADGSTTRRFGGTGLGLAISQRLVDLLGGEIRTHSTPGEGSRFEVWLPAVSALAPSAPPVPSAPPTPTEANPPPPARQARLAGLRVLAAEDNLVNQLVLTELLSIEGAQVCMCASGLAALEQLSAVGDRAFDVVLMDIQMPGIDGHETTRRLRAMVPDLPVIGQSAHALTEEHQRCLDSGMVELVVKPIDLEALVRAVLKHARQPAQPSALPG